MYFIYTLHPLIKIYSSIFVPDMIFQTCQTNACNNLIRSGHTNSVFQQCVYYLDVIFILKGISQVLFGIINYQLQKKTKTIKNKV